MKTQSKLRGLTFFLATSASVACACICVLLVAGEYHSAHLKLDTQDREYQGWDAFRKTNPAYFEANEEAAGACARNLSEARDNFWVKLPKTHLIGLFVATGLGSATAAYLATWALVWLVGTGLCRFARWLVLCFQPKLKRRPRSAVSAQTAWRTSG
jgi:hypothetical protein